MERLNDLEKLKSKLIREIEPRVNFIVNDNRAFIHSKIQRATLGQNFVHSIGGGNFSITLGVFAILNLLSKINAILNGAELWTEVERKNLKEALDRFKKQNKQYERFPFSIIKNQIKKSEADCFIEFYTDTKGEISWGIKNKENAGEVWSNFRNKLAHIALPSQMVTAYSPKQLKNIDFDTFITFLKADKNDILGLNGIDGKNNIRIALNAELFSEKLSDLFLFVKKKIETCDNEDKLKNTKIAIS